MVAAQALAREIPGQGHWNRGGHFLPAIRASNSGKGVEKSERGHGLGGKRQHRGRASGKGQCGGGGSGEWVARGWGLREKGQHQGLGPQFGSLWLLHF